MTATDPTPKMAKLAIHKGADAVLETEGLRFEACRREIEHVDGGVTLRVFSTGDDAMELLRFDCFRERPHYHAPGENQAETAIRATSETAARDWVFDALATRLPDLLDEAGAADRASTIDMGALAGLPARLGALFDDLAAPSETSYFEIEAAVLEQLRR